MTYSRRSWTLEMKPRHTIGCVITLQWSASLENIPSTANHHSPASCTTDSSPRSHFTTSATTASPPRLLGRTGQWRSLALSIDRPGSPWTSSSVNSSHESSKPSAMAMAATQACTSLITTATTTKPLTSSLPHSHLPALNPYSLQPSLTPLPIRTLEEAKPHQ
ncbi:hypothetical protein ACFX15_021320 [Malus domestica]